jgi:hypothetical protein
MAITFKIGWNIEVKKYANKYGPYEAFLSSFDENAINKALFDAKNKFVDQWVNKFIDSAMDPFDKKNVVTVEQGTHQTENMQGGGFCLHFTGRDTYGFALHFYIDQQANGLPRIFEITYMDKGRPVFCKRVN